jgi:iron complex outermembrane receptor protein
MKKLIILFLFLLANSYAQVTKISGKIIDAETGLPLEGANIILKSDKTIGAVSDEDGKFVLTSQLNPDDLIEISFIGYTKISKSVSSFLSSPNINLIKLIPEIISSQSVLVQAFRQRQEIAPLNYSTINRKEIKDNYTLQDVPQFLSSLPSTTFYSESGNGIGYNYLSIRGFDQRRISVSINGIPQNDPEDHNVYWLDFPDLISSADFIQVQKGSGSGVIGYPAIGGSVNIVTSSFANEPKFNLQASLGSYNTRKYSASFSSGLIDNKYSFHARLSQILSSGYREKSWVKFNSYHLSAVRFDDKLTTQINLYGGPIADGLAYNGLPKFAVKDKSSRRKNFSYWEADENQKVITYSIERRPDEIENFSQPHFEILNDYKFSDDVNFSSALFLVIGEGFFDYDGSWADSSYFRLTAENGFLQSSNPGDAIIRAQVENNQFGWIPRLNLQHENGNLIVGAEIRKHKSLHWGSINYAENLPAGITKDYRYYSYNGSKTILNAFVNENYKLNDNISLLGELQIAHHQYRLFNEKYIGTDFSVKDLFFNSRFGMNYKFKDGLGLHLSFARVTREPRLKNYYDVAESSGGEVPQFEKTSDGNFDFDKPYVQPETMNDLEIGAYISEANFSFSLNLFYMLFKNEIVKNGELDRFGQPVTGNMESTVHQGIEITASVNPIVGFEIYANATLSKNFINRGNYFSDALASIDLNGNRIGGFPDFLANLIMSYKLQNFYVKLSGKYVGKFYSDNFDSKLGDYLKLNPGFVEYSDNVNDAYFATDIFASYEFSLFESQTPSKVFLQVNNIFDNLYSAHAIGKEFYPAAERNFLIGLQIGL